MSSLKKMHFKNVFCKNATILSQPQCVQDPVSRPTSVHVGCFTPIFGCCRLGVSVICNTQCDWLMAGEGSIICYTRCDWLASLWFTVFNVIGWWFVWCPHHLQYSMWLVDGLYGGPIICNTQCDWLMVSLSISILTALECKMWRLYLQNPIWFVDGVYGDISCNTQCDWSIHCRMAFGSFDFSAAGSGLMRATRVSTPRRIP